MRSTIFILIVCLFVCCNKGDEPLCPDGLEEGRIIGQDFRLCPCCGGWWIEIGTDTLQSFTLPDNIKIDNSTITDSISIPVCLSYKKAIDCNAWGGLIDIEAMELQ